jgi:hypothetical protein
MLSAMDYIYLSIYLSMALQPLWTRLLFQPLNSCIVGRTPWTGDQSVARPLPTHREKQTQNKRTQASKLRVGFEPTIQMFERTKTARALDRAITVTGPMNYMANA